MAESLPGVISTFTVVGRLVKSVADSLDVGQAPDVVPIVGAEIVFTPDLNPPIYRITSTTPPLTVFQEAIVATTDSDGWLKIAADSARGVVLPYGMDSDLIPSGWTWRVKVSVGGNFPDRIFSVAGFAGGVLDLATLIPVPANPGQDLTQWQSVVNQVMNARDVAVAAAASIGDVEAVNDTAMNNILLDTDSAFRTSLDVLLNSSTPSGGEIGWVVVTTGNETRPPRTHVIWVGTIEPTNMTSADIWFGGSSSGTPTAAPVISTNSPLNGLTVGQVFTQQISASNTPTSWSATGLPAGVTINTSTGLISGTPSGSGTGTATITATNAGGNSSKQFAWTVSASLAAPNITSATLPSLTQGSPVNQSLSNAGGAAASVTIPTGSLPAGLSVSVVSGAVVLSGTPSASGAYSFTVRATNATGSSDKAFSGTIAAAATGPFNIWGASQPWAMSIQSDGGGALRVGNRFYTDRPNGILVRGLRLRNPAGAPSGFLTPAVTAWAIAGDKPSGVVIDTDWLNPTQVKVHNAARTADTWTDILFDTPINLAPRADSTGSTDFVTLAYQIAGGQYYAFAAETTVGNNSVGSSSPTGVHFAEGVFRRSSITTNNGASSLEPDWNWYGIDIIFEVI